ncbi:hypothetical protein TNIN_470981 [Trichonephila inaurata madagascariensis]|uniref:Uncharacterized protein n=1 Tax=Trichonephila inaurata madagascariensis TaxID=2747483 RepID=A0A8X6IYR0_9ARAC|nr:hypothetical protein TNIN_292501 [Trichonephila inaurata madagascariensis]GFY66375.1 hypothetical protein TNIN_470981 [Trichonephila inaurata madagascariensis]
MSSAYASQERTLLTFINDLRRYHVAHIRRSNSSYGFPMGFMSGLSEGQRMHGSKPPLHNPCSMDIGTNLLKQDHLRSLAPM